MKYISIIPARGGSKGIIGKNVKIIAGKPLIAWSIEQSLACSSISKTVVSTDDFVIAEVARSYKADVPFMRPAELAQDTSPTEPVMEHALRWFEDRGESFDCVVLLQATSPIRFDGTLDAAIRQFEASGAESLLGVCENHHFFWRKPPAPEALYDYRNRPRRQDIRDDERLYRENGSIYITKTASLLRHLNRLCSPITMYVMKEEEGWEIDSMADFIIAEALLKHCFNR